MATSGLDYDVKLWTPTDQDFNELKDLPDVSDTGLLLLFLLIFYF